jgi:uncharacterized membrane protein HdeD (DUF308 family)
MGKICPKYETGNGIYHRSEHLLHKIDDMKNNNFWWILTLAGVILVLLGIFCVISPLNAYIFYVHYSGITLGLNGLLLIMLSYTGANSYKEKNWLLTESVLDFFFAICLVVNPFITFITFPFLIGTWMIGKGILKVLASLNLKQIKGWIFICMGGILSAIFGLIIIYNPMERGTGITLFLGLYGLVMGTLYMFESIRFKKLTDTVDIML